MPLAFVDPPKKAKPGHKRNIPSGRSNTDAVTERNVVSPPSGGKKIPSADKYGRPLQRWGI